MPAPLPYTVTFWRPGEAVDGHGGFEAVDAQVHSARARLIYKSGTEGVSAGAETARGVIKVKLRSCIAARSLLASDYMRDAAGRRYNIRAVDPVTDPAFVWLDVEFGVADKTSGVNP
jgi:head-tail adaptor